MIWADMDKQQKIDAIRCVYKPGDSAGLLADKLGTTRRAIIGIYGRNPSVADDCPLREPNKGPINVRRDPAPVADVVIDDRSIEGYALADLDRDQCRWPVNNSNHSAGHRFCGAPGSPYCEKHMKMSRGRGTESERTAAKVLERYVMKSESA